MALPTKLFSFVFEDGGEIRLEIDAKAGDRPERWRFCVLNHGRNHAGHRIALMVEGDKGPVLDAWEVRPPLGEPRRVEVGTVRWFGERV
jgi:hypothetical protein